MAWSKFDIGCCCSECDSRTSESLDFSEDYFSTVGTPWWFRTGDASIVGGEAYIKSIGTFGTNIQSIGYSPECQNIPVAADWGASSVLTSQITLVSFTDVDTTLNVAYYADFRLTRPSGGSFGDSFVIRADIKNNDYLALSIDSAGENAPTSLGFGPTNGDVLKITVENSTATAGEYTAKFYINGALEHTLTMQNFGASFDRITMGMIVRKQGNIAASGSDDIYFDDLSWEYV